MKRIALVVALGLAWPAFATDLPAALLAAQQVDPQLASAAANRDGAAENVGIARGRLLPQVSLQGSSQQLSQTTTTGGKSNDFSGRSSSTQLSVRQGVYRPRDWAGLDAGRLQAEYGEAKYAAARTDLWNRVTQAWIDVLVAEAQRGAQAEAVRAVGQAAEQEKRRFALGDGTRDAMGEAAAQLAQARAQLTEAELGLQARQKTFQLLTGVAEWDFKAWRLPEEGGLNLDLGTEGDVLARALESNPDLASARLVERISERRLAQASADHWPTVDAIASSSAAKNDTTNTLGTQYRNTQFGFQVVVPLYAGGAISATQRQAAAAYAATSADRQAGEQRLSTQFQTDWRSLEALRERVRAAREVVDAAREQRRAAELGIKGGLRTWADVANAEMSIARRQNDRMGLLGSLLKTQARVLSLYPVTDPAWDRWTAMVSAAARR
jgi:outer membrane protein TolC